MIPWLRDRHANPSSIHSRGASASRALENARAEVASLLGVVPERVVFTSGATEANNLALRGAARLACDNGRPVVGVGGHEHPSLLHPARSLARSGLDLSELPVERDGWLCPEDAWPARLGVLGLSHAHAELGALQPLTDIVASARRRGALTVVDLTLTAGRIAVDAAAGEAPDLATVSFHHFGGPMGVGALILRDDLPLPPLIEGGTQERGYRPGSPNLAGAVGAGVASRLAHESLETTTRRLSSVGAELARALRNETTLRLTGPEPGRRLPGHLSLTVPGIDGEAVVVGLDRRGILAATGSACADRAGLPSAALRAAGHDDEEARGAVVLCLPPSARFESGDVLRVVHALREEVGRLRSVGGRLAPA